LVRHVQNPGIGRRLRRKYWLPSTVFSRPFSLLKTHARFR
jgi:hypothetical protein